MRVWTLKAELHNTGFRMFCPRCGAGHFFAARGQNYYTLNEVAGNLVKDESDIFKLLRDKRLYPDFVCRAPKCPSTRKSEIFPIKLR